MTSFSSSLPPPFAPTGEVQHRMLGEPAGGIPTVPPKPWAPMIMVGDTERTVHAVPTGTRALCGYESGTGWQWGHGPDVTCEHCCQKIMVEELDRDMIVQALRRYNVEVTRENYISFNWSGCDLKDWSVEWESELPAALQCWDTNEWPWKRRRARERAQKLPCSSFGAPPCAHAAPRG